MIKSKRIEREKCRKLRSKHGRKTFSNGSVLSIINKKKGTIHKFIDKSRKREVVYMEQMGTFMAEYAEWFYMGSSIVILILLIYVLHRIKKQSEKTL